MLISPDEHARALLMAERGDPDSLDANVRILISEFRLWGFSNPDSLMVRSGWVDWVIQGRRGTLFRELKSEAGELSPQQRLVGDRLRRHGCDWAVWRPRDLLAGRIRAELEAIR